MVMVKTEALPSGGGGGPGGGGPGGGGPWAIAPEAARMGRMVLVLVCILGVVLLFSCLFSVLFLFPFLVWRWLSIYILFGRSRTK